MINQIKLSQKLLWVAIFSTTLGLAACGGEDLTKDKTDTSDSSDTNTGTNAGTNTGTNTTTEPTTTTKSMVGDYWFVDNFTGFESDSTSQEFSLHHGVAEAPSKVTLSVPSTPDGEKLTATIASTKRITLNESHTLNATREVRTDTAQTATLNVQTNGTALIEGKTVDANYATTGFVPVYKDSVTNRYAYLRQEVKKEQETSSNRYRLETNYNFMLPKTATDTSVADKVKGNEYGGLIMQSQFPNLGGTVSQSTNFDTESWEMSRWRFDNNLNVNRPASSQAVSKLKFKSDGIKIEYAGDIAGTNSRTTRTATTTDNNNGKLTLTWGEGDGSTREATFTPDGMLGILSKHHTKTSFTNGTTTAVKDCMDTSAVADADLGQCQLGTRILIKLPSSTTQSAIISSLHNKAYRFFGMQIQGNNKGEFAEIFSSGNIKGTFSNNNGNLNLVINSVKAGTEAQIEFGNLTKINMSKPGDATLNFNFVPTSGTQTRLGEFELYMTGTDTQGNTNGDPAADSTKSGEVLRIYTSADGSDTDSAPDLIVAALYNQDIQSSTKDRSIHMFIGFPSE